MNIGIRNQKYLSMKYSNQKSDPKSSAPLIGNWVIHENMKIGFVMKNNGKKVIQMFFTQAQVIQLST